MGRLLFKKIKMKVLITGITGSGGSYFAEYLIEKGFIEVIGTSRYPEPTKHKNLIRVHDKVKCVIVDLLDFKKTLQIFDSEKPDIIFHLASNADVKKSFDEPFEIVNGNIAITLNILEALKILNLTQGYNPIIHVCSTAEVYGNSNSCLINESSPTRPINPYAVSKLAQDNLAWVYFLNYGLKVIRTRMFSYFNAKRSNLVASSFAIQIKKVLEDKQDVIVHGNLDSIRTILDIRDASEAYWLAATKGIAGEVYNIGANEEISIKNVLGHLIKISNKKIPTKFDSNLYRPSDIIRQVPDVSKFVKATGWKQNYNLMESLDFFWKEICFFW